MAHEHVLGLGGMFFRAKDPEALTQWYITHFGVTHPMKGGPWQQEAGPTVFAPFEQNTEYFGRAEQQFMVNFRVKDLEGFLKKLAAAGVKIAPERQSEVYGDFAWVYDPEGNKIELWEPKVPQ